MLNVTLDTPGGSTTHCNWIFDFLTKRPQTVLTAGHIFSILVHNTEAPWGHVLNPSWSSVDPCMQPFAEISTVKHVDDTTITVRISNINNTNIKH